VQQKIFVLREYTEHLFSSIWTMLYEIKGIADNELVLQPVPFDERWNKITFYDYLPEGTLLLEIIADIEATPYTISTMEIVKVRSDVHVVSKEGLRYPKSPEELQKISQMKGHAKLWFELNRYMTLKEWDFLRKKLEEEACLPFDLTQ
jgi:hypothetical protein